MFFEAFPSRTENDVFHCVECDMLISVMFASGERCACGRGWNTSHHFAATPQNITVPQGITSLARQGKHHFLIGNYI